MLRPIKFVKSTSRESTTTGIDLTRYKSLLAGREQPSYTALYGEGVDVIRLKRLWDLKTRPEWISEQRRHIKIIQCLQLDFDRKLYEPKRERMMESLRKTWTGIEEELRQRGEEARTRAELQKAYPVASGRADSTTPKKPLTWWKILFALLFVWVCWPKPIEGVLVDGRCSVADVTVPQARYAHLLPNCNILNCTITCGTFGLPRTNPACVREWREFWTSGNAPTIYGPWDTLDHNQKEQWNMTVRSLGGIHHCPPQADDVDDPIPELPAIDIAFWSSWLYNKTSDMVQKIKSLGPVLARTMGQDLNEALATLVRHGALGGLGVLGLIARTVTDPKLETVLPPILIVWNTFLGESIYPVLACSHGLDVPHRICNLVSTFLISFGNIGWAVLNHLVVFAAAVFYYWHNPQQRVVDGTAVDEDLKSILQRCTKPTLYGVAMCFSTWIMQSSQWSMAFVALLIIYAGIRMLPEPALETVNTIRLANGQTQRVVVQNRRGVLGPLYYMQSRIAKAFVTNDHLSCVKEVTSGQHTSTAFYAVGRWWVIGHADEEKRAQTASNDIGRFRASHPLSSDQTLHEYTSRTSRPGGLRPGSARTRGWFTKLTADGSGTNATMFYGNWKGLELSGYNDHAPGHSGSPIINSDGEVVAVHCGAAGNKTYAFIFPETYRRIVDGGDPDNEPDALRQATPKRRAMVDQKKKGKNKKHKRINHKKRVWSHAEYEQLQKDYTREELIDMANQIREMNPAYWLEDEEYDDECEVEKESEPFHRYLHEPIVCKVCDVMTHNSDLHEADCHDGEKQEYSILYANYVDPLKVTHDQWMEASNSLWVQAQISAGRTVDGKYKGYQPPKEEEEDKTYVPERSQREPTKCKGCNEVTTSQTGHERFAHDGQKQEYEPSNCPNTPESHCVHYWCGKKLETCTQPACKNDYCTQERRVDQAGPAAAGHCNRTGMCKKKHNKNNKDCPRNAPLNA